ncbi:hypothetical protein V8C34DRAFT_277078 [Trichoderma compactum]
MMRCFCCSWWHLFLSHVAMPTYIIGPVDPCIALCGKQDNLSDALDWELKEQKHVPWLAIQCTFRLSPPYPGIIELRSKILLCSATLCNSLIGLFSSCSVLYDISGNMHSRGSPYVSRPCCATLAEARSSGCHSSTQDTRQPGWSPELMQPVCQAMLAEIFLHPFVMTQLRIPCTYSLAM